MEMEKKMELVLNNGRYDKKMRFNVIAAESVLFGNTRNRVNNDMRVVIY